MAKTQHGPVFTAAYYPFGYGSARLPYNDAFASGTASTRSENNTFTSADKLMLAAGYFFGFIQSDFMFSLSRFKKQQFSENLAQAVKPDSDKKVYQLRAGKRFSNPGDTSYYWIYLGLKRMEFGSSYINLENAGMGYLAGFEGFNSFGLKHDFEFAVYYNIFLGSYGIENFSSDLALNDFKKKNSITACVDLGLGVQYEPRNIVILARFSSEIDHIAYNAELTGSNISIGCSSIGFYAGLSVVYTIPNFRYNQKK